MYNLVIPPDLVRELYELREDYKKGPIARQIREAIRQYIARTRQEISASQPAPRSMQSHGSRATQMSFL